MKCVLFYKAIDPSRSCDRVKRRDKGSLRVSLAPLRAWLDEARQNML